MFWATAVLLSLAGFYVLGLGPACWSSSRMGGAKAVSIAYRPITWAVELIGNDSLMNGVQWYSSLGDKDGFHLWSFSPDSPGNADWAPLFFGLLTRICG